MDHSTLISQIHPMKKSLAGGAFILNRTIFMESVVITFLSILVCISTFQALFIWKRAAHNQILGMVSLFAIGAVFVMANFLGKEALDTSRFLGTVVLLLFAIHFGCNFLWMFFHKQRKQIK